MNECIFCKIISREAEATRIFENDKILAFLDIQPINEGHLLIIPKSHAELINELDVVTVSEMMKVAQKLNQSIRNSGVKCEGIDYFIADGEAAGQEIPHVHLHLVPRFANDGFGFKYPVNYENLPSREELNAIGEKIKKK